MTYKDFRSAIEVLGLGERASFDQIKSRHRELAKIHHPDLAEAVDQEEMIKINSAYELVTAYCENYRFSFSEEEFLKQVPEERLRRQFGWDPAWGGQSKSSETEP